jgi:hypothetical protein
MAISVIADFVRILRSLKGMAKSVSMLFETGEVYTGSPKNETAPNR